MKSLGKHGKTLALILVVLCATLSLMACGDQGMDATTLMDATDTVTVSENEINFTKPLTTQLFKEPVAEGGFVVSYTVKGDDPTYEWVSGGGLYIELDGVEKDIDDDGKTDGNLWHSIVIFKQPKYSRDSNACVHIVESGPFSGINRNEGAEYATTLPFSVASNPIEVVIAYYDGAYYVMLDKTFKVCLTADTEYDETNKTQYLSEFFAPHTRKIGLRSTNTATTFSKLSVKIGDDAAKEAIKNMKLDIVSSTRSVASVKLNAQDVLAESGNFGSAADGRLPAKIEEKTSSADIIVQGARFGATDDETELTSDADKNGIVFTIAAKKSVVESGAQIGALLLPADLTDESELQADTVTQSGANIKNVTIAQDKWSKNDFSEYMSTDVCLYNIPVGSYNREIMMNAYIKSGEDYTYAGTVSRSLADVALSAENGGNSEAANYLKKYNVNFFGEDGETEIAELNNVTVRYGSTVKAPTDPENPDEVKGFAGWYADKALTQPFDFTQAIKGTTNIYSEWIDGYILKPGKKRMLKNATAAAGTGWTATVTVKGTDSDTQLERGGLYVTSPESTYGYVTFTVGDLGKTDGMYLIAYTDDGKGWKPTRAIKLADTYDQTKDFTLTAAGYASTLYFKVVTNGQTYTATYGGASDNIEWKYSAGSDIYGPDATIFRSTSSERKLGVASIHATARFEEISFAIGNDAAKTAITAMGLQAAENYSAAAGWKNKKFTNGTAAGKNDTVPGVGWTATLTIRGVDKGNTAAYERGGLSAEGEYGGGTYTWVYSVGDLGNKTDGMYLMIAGGNPAGNYIFGKAIKIADTYDQTKDITLTVANYNDVVYFKIVTNGKTYTASYVDALADNFAEKNPKWIYNVYEGGVPHNIASRCNSKEQRLGLSSMDSAADFENVTYAIGNDAAKAAATAMGFTVA